MKNIRFLSGFCFLVVFLFFSFSLQAQKGGTSSGCRTSWTHTFPIANGDEFIGTGTAQTDITDLHGGGGVNGWINYVVDGSSGSSAATYQMTLQLGTTPYKIVYKAPRVITGSFMGQPISIQQSGLLEVYVAATTVYSTQLSGTENRAVFRIAIEGGVMRFYKNDELIPLPSTVNADMGASVSTTISTNSDGRIHVSPFSFRCQELIPEFARTPIDCTSGAGTLSVSSVQGGSSPYFHYFDNANFNNVQAISSPSVGWITTVDQAYRAATYYMGVGKTITWQHTGTQLNGNVLTSLTSSSSALPSNTLSSQEEGWVGWRKEMATGWSVALVDATTSSSLYEFRGSNNLSSAIYIGGVYITQVQALLTDYLRISKEESSIKFYVNEVEVYSQSLLSSVDLKTKFSFTQVGATISYPTLSFCTSAPPAVITLASTNLSACRYDNVAPITPTTQHVTELRWYTTNPDGVVPRPTNYVSGLSFDPDGNNPGSLAAGTYTYYVTGVDLNGQETPSQAVTLTIYGLPSVSISSPSTLCPNSSITLTTSGQASTSTYKWFKDNVLLTGQSSSNLLVSQAGVYKVQVTTAQGCISTSEKTISLINFTLNLSYQTSSSGCGQVSLVTTSSINGISYKYQKKNASGTWSDYSIFYTYNIYSGSHTPVVPVVQSGIYRIYSTYQGCTVYSNELPVTIHPSVSSTIAPTPTVCQGNAVTLSVQNYNATYSYQWQQQVGGSWIPIGVNQSVIVPYVSGTTSASFQLITTASTGCTSIASRTINYTSSPTATYTSFVEAALGETVNFGVISNATSYAWTGPNGFTSTSANPAILVNANSYGEYILVVSNGSCQTTYRAVIAEKGVYATLKENLDASYYHTSREGKLYFKFDEKYGLGENGTASVSIFNYDFREVSQSSLSKVYGYNWYELDLSSFAAVVEGEHYILHIQDEWERRYVLRVKYATGNNKVIIGNDVTTCIPQSDALRTVQLEATSYVDIAPYSISWYVSTDYTKINQLETLSNTEREALLFAEEQNIDQQYSTALFSTQQPYINQSNVIYAPREGTYYVRAKIKNYCNGEETYSDQVVIITLNLDPACRVAELTSKEKHRFELFFSIRRLFSPKPETNPTTR